MKPGLRMADCLCRAWGKVDGLQRYREVASPSPEAPAPHVFAVFSEDGVFQGLVTPREAALFPNRVFADLLVRRAAPTVSADLAAEEGLTRLIEAQSDHLAVVDADGGFAGVVCAESILAALTKKLEEEIEYHRLATLVFDTTSEGILITDRNATIIHVNRAFTETTGYTLEDVVGKKPNILHSGRHEAEFYRAMWKSLRLTGKWEGELWNRRKNGDIYPEWLHINAVRGENGEVTHYVGVFSDMGPHKELQYELQRLAYYDVLTGLPNRRLFLDRLERAIALSQRTGEGFSLLFVDLDRFKNINDAYGHGLGDALLVEAARRLREAIRDSDTVARLGGDEFIVLLADCRDAESGQRVADKLREVLAEPIRVGEHEFSISATIGIALHPEDGVTATDLLRSADVAMYHAKAEQLGSSFFRAEILAQVQQMLAMENAIRRGLADGEFWLAWQPQVDLASGALVGLEALARWRHDGRDVSPAEFIPVAEKTGLIQLLGEWVFRQAAAEAVAFRKGCDHCPVRIAVNVSPLQLEGRKTVDRMARTLDEHGLPPEIVEIEVTESALMNTRGDAGDFLHAVAESGMALAVDDFGTGYSNLANLKRVQVDRLKIDMSFVRDLEHDEADRQIVQAVIAMAHGLGIEVVAEGIETPVQLRMLREKGCDVGQGYLFSRPVRLEEMEAFCNGCLHGGSHRRGQCLVWRDLFQPPVRSGDG